MSHPARKNSFCRQTCVPGKRNGFQVEYLLVVLIAILGIAGMASAWNNASANAAAAARTQVPPPNSPLANSPSDLTAATEQIASASKGILWFEWLRTLVLVCVGCYLIDQIRGRGRLPAEFKTTESWPSKQHLTVAERWKQKRREIRYVLSNNWKSTHSTELKVKDLMSRDLLSVSPEDTIESVRSRMDQLSIQHLLVVDPQRRLYGIISDRDLSQSSTGLVDSVTTRNPVTVEPESEIGEAISKMLRFGIHALPVVADERPVGIITTTDLIATLQCMLKPFSEFSQALKSDSITESSKLVSPHVATRQSVQ